MHVEDASSDGLGLESVRKAVVGANGQTWLAMAAEGERARATLHIVLPVEVEVAVHNAPTTALAPPQAAPPSSSAAAAAAVEAHREQPAAASSAHRPLVCCCDDSDAMRGLLDMIIEDFMGAERPGELSGAIGATRAEQNAFVDVAMGRLDLALRPRAKDAARQADITIIDQNLPSEEEPNLPVLLGTNIVRRRRDPRDVAAAASAERRPARVCVARTPQVRQLRAEGFLGVCCILTGASDEEIAAISSSPGVDLAMPKITSAKKLAERCLAAAAEKRELQGMR